MESRIAELSSKIASNVSKIDAHLASLHQPSVSFDSGMTSGLFSGDSLKVPRQEILEATHELHRLMLGPVEVLTSAANSLMFTWQAIYKFNIARSFENEATYQEIASACGLSESVTRRILRNAMANNVFREPKPGYVTHTAASKMFAMNPLMHNWIGMVSEELWPAASRTVDALLKWPGSEEPNHAGWNVFTNTEKNFFTEISGDAGRTERFAKAMSLFSLDKGYGPDHLVHNYPWDTIGNGTIVDVGGSHGSFSIPVVRHFPGLHCIIQDRPEVVATGLEDIPPELRDRVTYMAHDFFNDQPVKGADLYLFRWILHDWSDKYAIRILKALVPALKKGARVLLLEYVLPEPGTVPYYQEKKARSFDMQMMFLLNSTERESGDWKALFREADSRFELLSIKQPPTSKLSFIEAQWTGE